MRPQLKVNRKQIALIHVAKADLIARGVLDEEGYRDLLRQFPRFDGQPAASSKDLVEAQADELLTHFKKCGWVYLPKVKKAPPIRREARNKQIYLGAIQTILGALGKDWSYADGIARQMFGVDQAKWCSPEQLHKIQQALIYQERRLAGDPPQPRPETLQKRRERSRRRAEAGETPALPEEYPF